MVEQEAKRENRNNRLKSKRKTVREILNRKYGKKYKFHLFDMVFGVRFWCEIVLNMFNP